jgi:hypothetical protein
MRASRQTDLQREFPIHVVCSWLGNSPQVAQGRYLPVTEADFAKAVGVTKVLVGGEIIKEKTPRFLNNVACTLQLRTVQGNFRSIHRTRS